MKIFCTCKHEYQDKKYGNQMRIGNKIKTTGGVKVRCTVCGKEITV
jgi:preprotein translocase subunit YajC